MQVICHDYLKFRKYAHAIYRLFSAVMTDKFFDKIFDSFLRFEANISNNNNNKLSRIVRKPDFCLGENKGADQLRGNREADQRICFRYTDSIFPLLLISEISRF